MLSVFPPVRFAPKNADTITISLFLFTYKFGNDRSSNAESEFSCVVEKKERRKNGSKNSTSDY